MTVVQLTTDNREPFRQYHKPRPWFGAAPAALLEGFEQTPEVQVHVVSCTQQPMPASPEKLAPNIWFHSLHVPKLGWMRTGYQGCIRAARRKIREIAPALVHGQGTERDCALSAVSSGRPNVVTIHGNMAEMARLFAARPFTYSWITGKLENLTLPLTAGVFCNSRYTSALVASRARRTWSVANPLRTAFFADIPQHAREPLTIVNIGFVEPRKRQLEILEMAERLHRDGAGVQFEFIGQCLGATPYQRAFSARMVKAERAGFARWLPEQNPTSLIARLDRASALLHFPVEEAFGLVVAEALARNLKLFGARVGGIGDIADGIELAELHPATDWEGLARGIRAWAEAGAPRPGAAADAMRERYHPKVIAQQHLEIYRTVLGEAGVTGGRA